MGPFAIGQLQLGYIFLCCIKADKMELIIVRLCTLCASVYPVCSRVGLAYGKKFKYKFSFSKKNIERAQTLLVRELLNTFELDWLKLYRVEKTTYNKFVNQLSFVNIFPDIFGQCLFRSFTLFSDKQVQSLVAVNSAQFLSTQLKGKLHYTSKWLQDSVLF